MAEFRNVLYAPRQQDSSKLNRRSLPFILSGILLALCWVLNSKDEHVEDLVTGNDALVRLQQKFAQSNNGAAMFSMLDSWRRRPSGVSYFAKLREARESSEMQHKLESSQLPSTSGVAEALPSSPGQQLLASSFQRLNGGDSSFREMQEKYLAQNDGQTQPLHDPSTAPLSQTYVSDQYRSSSEPAAYTSNSIQIPSASRFGAVFQRNEEPAVQPRNRMQYPVQSFVPYPENIQPEVSENSGSPQLQYSDVKEPQQALPQQMMYQPAPENSFSHVPFSASQLANSPLSVPQFTPYNPRYSAVFDARKPSPPIAESSGTVPRYAAIFPPVRETTPVAVSPRPGGPQRLSALQAEDFTDGVGGSALPGYDGSQTEEAEGTGSAADDGYVESDGGAAVERDAYGDPVPLSYPDLIPTGPAGVLTREDRLRALQADAERVRLAQDHLQREWTDLMRRPPPVTASTRPDIIDPDDYATTSADFDKKRKEMLAFKAALMAFKSDPEFNPMIVMLAHTLVRYGVPPPESDDIHVWQQWYREADDKFKILEQQVERMASGHWQDAETSWERHHLRRPGAYKKATRAEVRLPDDSFADGKNIAITGGGELEANRTISWSVGGNGTLGEEALEEQVEDLARRLHEVEAQLQAERAAGGVAVATKQVKIGRAGGSLLAAKNQRQTTGAGAEAVPPKSTATAAAPPGTVTLPPPPKAVVKWLADAFLSAEQANHVQAVDSDARKPPTAVALVSKPPAPAHARVQSAETPRAVACSAGECRPVHRGPPVAVRAAVAPPAVHTRKPSSETPLMQTGPVPGRVDMLKKGADMLKLENKALPTKKPAAAGSKAAQAAELKRLAEKVIKAGTMPPAASPPPPPPPHAASTASAASVSAGKQGGSGGAKYTKAFVGGRTMYLPAYDHTKTTDDGWGWLWGR